MAPGDIGMYAVGIVAIIAGAQLAWDPASFLALNKPMYDFFQNTFGVVSPPTSAAALAVSGQEDFFRFIGALVYSLGVYYFLAAHAGDEYFKRSTVWGRIPFGLFNLIWPLRAGSSASGFFFFFGWFDLITGLIMAYQVGFGGGLGYAKEQRKLKRV